MLYNKEKTQEISFPLGGIGAGCIGLAGNGRLCDWEIFNQANKNSILGRTHFCISTGGKYRLLQGDCFEPYTGKYRQGSANSYWGFGWGPESDLLAGLPHFRNHAFNGTFPVAEVTFSGEEQEFPISAKLTAWSPFVPGMDRESSLPCAVLEYTFENISSETVDATAVGVIQNPWKEEGHVDTISCSGTRLTMSDGKENQLVLTLLEDPANVSGQAYWYRGGWSDALEMYLNELTGGKPFPPRTYGVDEQRTTWSWDNDHGDLAAHFTLNPGEKRVVKFLITWSIPERTVTWSDWALEEADRQGVPRTWRNYYATQWKDANESADELTARFDELRSKTMQFRDLLHNSTLDPSIIDGASSCLSTLKSPTCLRLEDGTFYGWEGTGSHWGSCEGSCIHVWNYAQAAAFLFPALERSMQESHLKYSVDSNDAVHFRIQLPPGIKAQTDWFRSCADGQFGIIMKCYRDWKICGDNGWLKTWYPTLKRLMQYAWSATNTDQWDPEKTGLLGGRQHHTLDMELFSPNSWLEGFYLGALAAMVKMAEAMDDKAFMCECAEVLKKGQAASNMLFNGEYYQQIIDLNDKSLIDKWEDTANYWNDEAKEIKYQIGDGLEIDACLGEFFARFYGIGSVLDEAMTESTLNAIYKYNFRCTRDYANPWRIYAVNDEKGVCICTWENGKRKPAIPIPYNTEMMNGFEWAFATHLMLLGREDQATEIARAIRERYDGKKRNPWNEFECGNNYARSMAAFGMIPAALGFQYDLTSGMIGFQPTVKNLTRCLWSLGTVWGEYRKEENGSTEIRITAGSLQLKKLVLKESVRSVKLNGNAIDFTACANGIEVDVALKAGDVLTLN